MTLQVLVIQVGSSFLSLLFYLSPHSPPPLSPLFFSTSSSSYRRNYSSFSSISCFTRNDYIDYSKLPFLLLVLGILRDP